MKPIQIAAIVGLNAFAAFSGFVVFSNYSKQKAHENRPIITEDCVMNGFGQGNCTFTNTGKTSGAVCGVIRVMGPGMVESSKFCSGQVEPQSTRKVEFHIPEVDQLCDNGFESWTEKCDFTFVRDDAPKTQEGGVQV